MLNEALGALNEKDAEQRTSVKKTLRAGAEKQIIPHVSDVQSQIDVNIRPARL